MEIFELNTRYITNILIKFQNKEIDEKKLNNNIFADLSFGFYFFQKKIKESKKKLKIQNELLQDFMKKEADQELYYNNLKGKYKELKDAVKTEEVREKQRGNSRIPLLIRRMRPNRRGHSLTHPVETPCPSSPQQAAYPPDLSRRKAAGRTVVIFRSRPPSQQSANHPVL